MAIEIIVENNLQLLSLLTKKPITDLKLEYDLRQRVYVKTGLEDKESSLRSIYDMTKKYYTHIHS